MSHDHAICAYTTFGARTGYPLLLIHAFPLTGAMWFTQAQSLSLAGYFVIVPDLRGFGASPVSPLPVTMDQMAADILAIADECHIDRFAVAGLSMGGYVVFALLRLAHQRCSHLMLIDTRASADSESGLQGREELALLAIENGSKSVADRVTPRLLSEFTVQNNRATVETFYSMVAGNDPLGIANASRGMALRPDSTALLSSIAAPTLVCVGEIDTIATVDESRAMANAISGAKLTVLPNAGHLTAIESPGELLYAMASFMRNTGIQRER